LIAGAPEENKFRQEVEYRAGVHSDYNRAAITELIPSDRKNQYAEFLKTEEELTKVGRASYQAYLVMSDLKGKMDALTADPYASLFVGRRFKEGGQKLLDAYVKITDDMISSLSQSQKI